MHAKKLGTAHLKNKCWCEEEEEEEEEDRKSSYQIREGSDTDSSRLAPSNSRWPVNDGLINSHLMSSCRFQDF